MHPWLCHVTWNTCPAGFMLSSVLQLANDGEYRRQCESSRLGTLVALLVCIGYLEFLPFAI